MEQKTETISVVVPAYNCAPYLTDTLQSVLAQTVQPLEILVIDDHSDQETQAILETFSHQESKIHVYRNEENRGVAYSRNRGVSLAKGDWIAFLDSDDQWAPEKLEKQLAMLKAKNGVFGFTGSAFMDESGQRYSGIFEVPETVSQTELLRQNVISCSSVMIRRELMVRYPMKSDDIHEDFDAWLRILSEVPAAYGLNAPLLIYRLSPNSKSGNKLKSFRMNYKTYRSVGLSPWKATANMYWYTKNGLKKYKNIKK